jgi:hypothetical protein
MIMDLPNHTTRFCPELRDELSKVTAVAKVEAVDR